MAHTATDEISHEAVAALLGGTHDEILQLVIPDTPGGLRGFLKRSAAQSHPRAYYHLLVTILREATISERRALSHHHDLDLDFLQRWSMAPLELRKPSVLSAFKDKVEFAELLVAVDVLEGAGLCRAAIIARLSEATSPQNLSVAVRSLLAGLEFKSGPLSGNADIVPVASVAALNKAARALRNCSASHIFDVLDGRSSFYVIRPDDPSGMVHLEREEGRWIINDIVGKSNRPVSREVAGSVFEYFESRGILRGVSCRPSQWDSVRRFCRMHHGMM